MSLYKKIATFLAAAALLNGSVQNLHADTAYTGGSAYRQSVTSPNLTPAVALGAVAIVAIIAVAVQNSSNQHSHNHGHFSTQI